MESLSGKTSLSTCWHEQHAGTERHADLNSMAGLNGMPGLNSAAGMNGMAAQKAWQAVRHDRHNMFFKASVHVGLSCCQDNGQDWGIISSTR